VAGGDQNNPDGWTFSTLYKHVTMLSDAQKDAVKTAMASAQKAVDKAEAAQQLRNDAQNEWRAAMKDQQATFADKEQTERRLGFLEQANAAQGGKERGIGAVGAFIIGAAVVLAGIIAAAGFILSVAHH
jgi:hypothetical protein